jgi:cytochrome c553
MSNGAAAHAPPLDLKREHDLFRKPVPPEQIRGWLVRHHARDSQVSMNATRLLAAALVGATIPTVSAAAAEAPPGATSCSGCHAANASVDSPVPRLVGRNAAELVAQMQAFRSGQRAGTVMGQIAKGFSDAEVEAIAAWYAAQH